LVGKSSNLKNKIGTPTLIIYFRQLQPGGEDIEQVATPVGSTEPSQLGELEPEECIIEAPTTPTKMESVAQTDKIYVEIAKEQQLPAIKTSMKIFDWHGVIILILFSSIIMCCCSFALLSLAYIGMQNPSGIIANSIVV